jgi:iron complex transport system permease protein
MAPHIARMIGYRETRSLVIISFLIGSILTVSSDFIGTIIFAPNEIPAGLIASVIGALYLLFLLNKQASR